MLVFKHRVQKEFSKRQAKMKKLEINQMVKTERGRVSCPIFQVILN